MSAQPNLQRESNEPPREVAAVSLPTPFGPFTVRAFECASGLIYLAVIRGNIADGDSVLTRLHSECLTGDVLGSLRCDCGVQLRTALRAVAAEGRGVVIYLTGQEGRGIGLVNKLRAYIEQDGGADTVEANRRLGLAVDARDYTDAGRVLGLLGVRSVALLTNNPDKARGLRQAGIPVAAIRPLATVPHLRNRFYLETKRERLGHRWLNGSHPSVLAAPPADVSALIGDVSPRAGRPYVIVKYAQTVDGRIATATGDSKWISGEAERRVAHGMRAACDAVMVGAATVATDDPRLTVRMVSGASPLRVVLDSTLRTGLDAHVVSDEAATVIITTAAADHAKVAALRARGVSVVIAGSGPCGVDVKHALSLLRASGTGALLVEGGSRVITSLLEAGVVDRLVVSISPTIIGAGVEAVGPLGVARVADGLRLTNRTLCAAGDDLLLAWDVVPAK